jgi:hypothetical protein
MAPRNRRRRSLGAACASIALVRSVSRRQRSASSATRRPSARIATSLARHGRIRSVAGSVASLPSPRLVPLLVLATSSCIWKHPPMVGPRGPRQHQRTGPAGQSSLRFWVLQVLRQLVLHPLCVLWRSSYRHLWEVFPGLTLPYFPYTTLRNAELLGCNVRRLLPVERANCIDLFIGKFRMVMAHAFANILDVLCIS